MSTGIPYLGSKISLISKSEIRYEGILYTIDTKESTVALAKVRSYGTEDRPTDRPVAPRDETYEYIIFRGADIKDIRVCQPPKPQPTLEGGLPNDPAIVQHSGGPPLFGAPGQTGAPGTAPFSQSNKTPTAGANNYGPIGSSAPGGGQPFSAAPGSTVNNQKRRKRTRRMSGQRSYRKRSGKSTNGSPVMDMLRDGNRSGQSSPAQGHREKRPSSRSSAGAQNGRGGPTRGRGMFRGRGYRGGGMPNQNFRGGAPGIRGGFQPGRPHANKKESLKFEKDYDLEQKNFAQRTQKIIDAVETGKVMQCRKELPMYYHGVDVRLPDDVIQKCKSKYTARLENNAEAVLGLKDVKVNPATVAWREGDDGTAPNLYDEMKELRSHPNLHDADGKLKIEIATEHFRNFGKERVIVLHEVFKSMDTNDNSVLDTNELMEALAKPNSINRKCSREEVHEALVEIDSDESGSVDFFEFLLLLTRLERGELKSKLFDTKAFKEIPNEVKDLKDKKGNEKDSKTCLIQ